MSSLTEKVYNVEIIKIMQLLLHNFIKNCYIQQFL